jgi:hypothetical protein
MRTCKTHLVNVFVYTARQGRVINGWVQVRISASRNVVDQLLGEQSVGKSFALNHLMDTSFAGSAMRTTGACLASSPTFRNRLYF